MNEKNEEVVVDEEIENKTDEKAPDVVPEPVLPEPEEPIVYDVDNLKNIEVARGIFLKQYKVQNIIKWIVSLIAFGMIIVGWLIFLDINVWLTVGIIVASLLLILLYNFFIKRYLNDKMKIYFEAFYQNTSQFVFDDANYSDVDAKVENKIEMVQFTENDLFANVAQVGSRNLTTYKYKGVSISVCDAAGQTKGAKSLVPVFVGKYFMAENSYQEDETIVIYLKGNEKALPPTNVAHLNVISDDSAMAIYSNNSDALKIVNKKIQGLLKKINTDNILIDVAIAIKKGKTFVCAGYDDILMVLPLEKPFDPKATRNYKDDLLNISEFIAAL